MDTADQDLGNHLNQCDRHVTISTWSPILAKEFFLEKRKQFLDFLKLRGKREYRQYTKRVINISKQIWRHTHSVSVTLRHMWDEWKESGSVIETVKWGNKGSDRWMINWGKDKSQRLLAEGAKIYRRHPRSWLVRYARKTTGAFIFLLNCLVNHDLHKPSGLRQTFRPLKQFLWFKGSELWMGQES